MKKVLIVILAILVLSPLMAAENGDMVEVVAEGEAIIKNGDVDSAKKAALQDAKRNAVDQVGSEIVSETVVSNYKLVRDKIISRVAGYVHGYRILEEGKRGNSYYVKIRAKVSAKSIKDDATLIYSEMNKPRIMILVSEIKNNKPQLSIQGENVLIQFFREKGFNIVDASRVKAKIERNKLRALAEGHELEAAKLGYQYGAEVVITGQVNVSRAESVMGQLYAAKSNVTLRAIDAATGKVYAVVNVEGKGIDAVPSGAISKAVENGMKSAARELFWKIVKEWNSSQLNGSQFEVTVRGVSYSDLRKLIRKIKSIKGVREVIKRSFDRPVAVLDVTFMGDSDRLAELLDGLRCGRKKAEVNEVTAGSIEIILK